MFWLSFRVEEKPVVFIQPAHSAIAARLRVHLADETVRPGHFQEAHELDAKTVRRIPRPMIGRRLTGAQARKLLRQIAA